AIAERVREHPRGVGGGDRVARPDVRDARGDTDALGRSEQHRAVRERLARPEALRIPQRVVAELLDLARSGSCVGRWRDGEGTDPASDLAELHRRTIEPDRRPPRLRLAGLLHGAVKPGKYAEAADKGRGLIEARPDQPHRADSRRARFPGTDCACALAGG